MQLWDRKKVWFNQLSDYNETSPKYNSDMGIDPSHGCWHTSDSEPASETVYQVKSHNYIIIAVFCLLQFSLSRYSNSEIRLGFSWEFCIWRYIGQPICWRSNFSRAPDFCSILPFMVKPNEIFKFWHQIWNLLKIALQVMFKPFNLVRVKFFKSAGIFQHFAFYSLAWLDIQILTPDLESPQNCTPDDTQTIQFGEGQLFCLLWPSLTRYSNTVIWSGFSQTFHI